MNTRTTLFLFLILLCNVATTYAQQIRGTITDDADMPLPFASIYVKNSTLGVTTDVKGRYIFDLDSGENILVFSYLGFKSIEKNVSIGSGESVVLDIVLEEDPTEIGEVQVVGNTKGLAKEIMSKARKNRKRYLNQLNTYQCQTYVKQTLDRKLINPSKGDTTIILEKEEKILSHRKKEKQNLKIKQSKSNRKAYFEKENLELIETVSEVYFQHPRKYQEKIIGRNDYSKKHNQASIQIVVTDNKIAPDFQKRNPYLIYKPFDPIFNFYQTSISFPSLCSKPILSPLALNAPLNYAYNYEGAFYEDGQKVYKIRVKPRFKGEALFNGIIFIEDSTFAIKSVDLSINRAAMMNCRDFKILQNYELIDDKFSLPVRREVVYTIKDGKNNFIGNVSVRHNQYKINQPITQQFSRNETMLFALDALEKDSTFWVKTRPITIKKEELKFMSKIDSIKKHHESPEYKRQQDSIFNHVGIWDVTLTGIGHKDSEKGYQITFSPLIDQPRFLGIGGYRHNLGTAFRQRFKNNQILHLEGDIDYGFRNKDIKGSVGIGYTFMPKRFLRTFIRFGDTYTMINNTAAIESIFSRNNYVRKKSFSISQRMEIINGLFARISLQYSNQLPITNIHLSDWSKETFGEQNTPADFKAYRKAQVDLRLEYTPFQKYYFYRGHKIIIGSDWPNFALTYKKGIPRIFNSEVNFDYLELEVKDYQTIGRFGYSTWAARLGSFVNHQELRFLEHKFFTGTNQYLFSNPVNAFNLLNLNLNTRNEFFRVNYIHHFEGAFMSKIPLVRYLKLELAAGLGSLLIRDIEFAHFEFFGGVERKVKIFKQQFRVGLYGVTSDNNLDKANIRLKLGVNVFNSYSRKWIY